MGRLFTHLAIGIALIWLLIVVVCAVVPQLVSPHDPLAQNLAIALHPPSANYWLGTDALGRDILSRLIWGARPAAIGIVITIVTAGVVGIVWGLISGYFGGAVDTVMMRLSDIVQAFPGIIFALALVTVLGSSLAVTTFALGLAFSPAIARVTRASVLRVRRNDYVEVTRMFGKSELYRAFRLVLPNSMSPVIVQLTILGGLALLAQTGLGFLGVGVEPPQPAWGDSLAETFKYISVNPLMSVPAGLVVAFTVMAIYEAGDAVRDRHES
jgi:ABC-type dipeptide/oligopeptide/nickel transport system permease subunit